MHVTVLAQQGYYQLKLGQLRMPLFFDYLLTYKYLPECNGSLFLLSLHRPGRYV